MRILQIPIGFLTAWVLASVFFGCGKDPYERLYGTWSGKTRIDQDITIRIHRDSTIEIETDVDSVRQVQKGTFQIIDRRIRIQFKTMETYTDDGVVRQEKTGTDEAVFTLTRSNELVLRRSLQAIVLQKVGESP